MDEAIEYIASRKWIADDEKYCFDTIYVFDDKVLTEVVVDGMCVVRHKMNASIIGLSIKREAQVRPLPA